MHFAVYATWFPDTRALLISCGDTAPPTLIGEQDVVDQLGPRASAKRNQYWELPKDGVLSLPANAGSRYTVHQTGGGVGVQLELSTEHVGDETLICISYAREDAHEDHSKQNMQVRLLPNPRKEWSDVGELHGYARDILRLGPQDHVQAIWISPIADAGGRLHVGPSQQVWPYGGARCIEVRPLEPSTRMTSRMELIARADRLSTSGAKTPPASLSPMDHESVILLVWRNIFSGRLNTKVPNPFLRTFHDNVQNYMGCSIAFDRDHSVAATAKRPIARGWFFPRPRNGGPSSPADLISWEFDGPIDIHDILLLCVRSLPRRPVQLLWNEHQALKASIVPLEGLQLQILCWQADLHHLAPVAWEAIADEVRSALTAQLKEELLRPSPTAGLFGDPPSSATVGFETKGHRVLEAQDKAVAAARRGSAIQHTDLFSTDPDLSGVVEEWFATLPTAVVQRLWSNRRSEQFNITNLARFLPINVAAMLDDPGQWAVLEREAEEFFQRIIDVISGLSSMTVPFAAHLRGDTLVWKSIGCADVLMPPDKAAELDAIMKAFAPNEAGSFAPLDPAILKSVSGILKQLGRLIDEMSRGDEAAAGVAESADPPV